jgi:2-haloacid dehalogenase
MARPQVILFDLNETLLDLHRMKERIGKLLDGGPDAARLRFTTLLQYSLVTTRIP